MLLSFAFILIFGLVLGQVMQKMRLPGLIGMLVAGIILGPHVLNLISIKVLTISSDLRQICLIIILLRAGLSLDIDDLKKIGRPAVCMCFIPATIEILTIGLIAPIFFPVSRLEGLILGAVLGAVSPAVIVPKMINLIENGYGRAKAIPQLILAGASVDDIYVIVLFTSFLGMYHGKSFDIKSLMQIPFSIFLGAVMGILCGVLLVFVLKKTNFNRTAQVLLVLSVSFFLVSFEEILKPYLLLSGLLAVMTAGITIRRSDVCSAQSLSAEFSKVWILAEIILFVLVGASVDISYVWKAGIPALGLIFIALFFRAMGVLFCLLFTDLNKQERLFCAIAYLPKATVQAAIGAIPLAQGVASGELILTICVLAILITAPVGAIGMEVTYKKFLSKDVSSR